MDNIIKEEASVFPQLRKALQAREVAEIDYSKVYTIPIGHSPVKGPDTAPIVIVEFSDFQCPFCTKAAPVVKQVLNTYPNQVKFVYKHFPTDKAILSNQALKNFIKNLRIKGWLFWLFPSIRETQPS